MIEVLSSTTCWIAASSVAKSAVLIEGKRFGSALESTTIANRALVPPISAIRTGNGILTSVSE